MKTQNKVQLIGYLGLDPVIIKLPSGTTKARLRLATDKFRRDQSGNVQRKVTWHDVIAWDKLAETIENQYITGSHILVEGEIIHRSYEDKMGQTHFVSEVKAFSIMNLDR
ncbi:MAG: single-stranded DNA-binding protein [Bacteroidota bacterium]